MYSKWCAQTEEGAGLGWRHSVRWAHLIHQVSAGGSIVHWKQHNIYSQSRGWICVELRERTSGNRKHVSPKDNSTVKNKRTWWYFFKNQYQNCSTLCFFHSFDLLAVLSLRMMDGGFLTHFCITGLWSDPHANTHRVCLCTPWIHSQFTIISFPPLL